MRGAFRIHPLVLLIGGFCATTHSLAATINAANCSQSAVQTAINSASNGDTVTVPAGNCTWSGLSLNKGIHLQGSGSSSTAITVTGTITITKHSTHNVRLSAFTFSGTGGVTMFVVKGAWAYKPPLIHDNVFTVNNAGIVRYETNGGVIFRNTFRSTRPPSNGFSADPGIQHKLGQAQGNTEWPTPDTMGIRDTDGTRNLYLEDNVFDNMSTVGTDFDDGARVVFRYNTLTNVSINSHGLDTSPVGVRHYEIYNNTFLYPSNTVNQPWFFWFRGGTGVIHNNSIANITGQMWGDKKEILFSVRMANDGGSLGCATGYPAPHQLGQNHNGSSQFTDPVRFWGNTGAVAWQIQQWSNSCGLNINDYLKEGRDFVFASSPKSGYAAYPYPHPLRGSSPAPSGLAAPGNLRLVAQ